MTKLEKRKKHIDRLPVTEYPNYRVGTDEIAVTIPLFYSPVDSGWTDYDESRIRDIHVKGAIWTALSLINNTDLADCGVGIYFHLEDKIYDIASSVFDKFGVSEQFIRVLTIDDFESPVNIDSVQYGKKYMFLEDEGLTPQRWLLMDSDAFVCKRGDKFEWYNCLRAFVNPSALNVVVQNYGTDEEYRWWVWMCCLAAGIPYDRTGDIQQQERDALSKLEVPDTDKISHKQRWYTCSQMVVLPVHSNLVDYLKRHYKRCHWDEGLLNVYQMLHEDISYLPGKLGGLNKWTFESEYIARDKSLDMDGYVAHLLPDNREEMTRVDEYWDEFYESLLPSAEHKKSYSGISQALARTDSDKERLGAHRYGVLYDLIFDSVYLRQGRPLRVCEIGVSMFGVGSLKAYQDIDIVQSVVAIDTDVYKGVLADSTTFYQRDAYTVDMIDTLKAEHAPFDIIIDDGSHDPVHQEFFLRTYNDLLSAGGIMICEDVADRDFFVRMRKEHDLFSFDGWANREGKFPDGDHNERMLIYTKPIQEGVIAETKPVGRKIVKWTRAAERLRFFVLSIPYARTSMDMITCAFVQRTWKLCKVLHKLGHEIIHLGHVDSDVSCSERIHVTDNDVLKEAYGYVPHDVVPGHSVNDHAFTTFAENSLPEIRKRAQKDDLVLAMYGWGHKVLCDSLSDLPVHIVEPSIGYPDSFAKYRCYQSSSKMHFERGKRSTYHKLLEEYPDNEDIFRSSLGQALSENMPDHNTVVFPNLYNFEHFKYSVDKGDYILYLGRIHACKGLEIAFNLAEYTNMRLIVAGPGDINTLGFPIPKQVEYVGVADVFMRSALLEKAIAIICPSLYLEPGLGTHIESLFAGTPPVTTNWGAPMDYNDHERVGFRCQDFNDFVVALENIESIDPAACRDYAIQFSAERLSISYHDWFHRIIRYENAGLWSVDTDCKDLNWLNRHMTEDAINSRIMEIQGLTCAV